ncbi:MAG: hypothetical protein R2882_14390 [Gemmatimonadales bacterium]
MSSPLFAHVAVPLPVATPYTYSIPEALADRVVACAWVVVPLRKREMVGIVTAVDDRALKAVATRPVLAAPDPEPGGAALAAADRGVAGGVLRFAVRHRLQGDAAGRSGARAG